MTPEEKARVGIDALLQQAGWHVCDMAQANIHAARGVALREFPLKTGFGFADYLLYIDGKAAGAEHCPWCELDNRSLCIWTNFC